MSFLRPRLRDSDFPRSPLDPRPDTSGPESIVPPPAASFSATAATNRQADKTCFADIDDRPVDWLWQDRLASRTLAMISGDPGSGKASVALAIAAALSRGRVPSSPVSLTADLREPHNIPYSSAGKEAAELVRPRFAKLDGDPARCSYCAESFPPAPRNPRQI
jgi:AAA domain